MLANISKDTRWTPTALVINNQHHLQVINAGRLGNLNVILCDSYRLMDQLNLE